jgi:type II secretory pathway pseudopilin PulG
MSRLPRLRDERGYTLIELVMATAAGLVVCATALAIVVTSLHLGQADADRVDSNQQGSTAIERIVQALASSCVAGEGSSPIIGSPTYLTGTGPYLITSPLVGPYPVSGGGPASSATSLTFVSTLSDAPNAIPSEVTIYLSSSGSLMMATYAPVTTSPPTWTFATTPTITTLIPHAALATGQTALFTYSGYNVSSDALTDSYTPATSLSQANAANVAKVGIQFQSQPSDGSSANNGGAVDVSDSVVLRLSAATNTPSTASTPTPCA